MTDHDQHDPTDPACPTCYLRAELATDPQFSPMPRRVRVAAGRLQWEAPARRSASATRCSDRGACASCAEQLRHDLDRAIDAIPAAHRGAHLLRALLLWLPREERAIVRQCLATGGDR